MQIIVLGMHRSGTSLVTRMVSMMGAYVGEAASMLGFTKDNPKGYWERKDVIDYNIALLKLHGTDWAGYNPLNWPMPYRPTDVPPALQQSMKSLILHMNAHQPWVMKDPRLCLTFPCWKPLLEAPVCVIVYRDPLEIAESLYTRSKMPLEYAVALWEFYAVAALNVSAELPRVFVSHSDFLYDPVSTTAQLYHGLAAAGVKGLKLPSNAEITDFIDPALYRSKPKESALTGYRQDLAAMMRGDYAPKGVLTVSEASRNVMRIGLPIPT